MSLWLDAIDRYIEADEKISIILDLGCGTGRFSTALALWFDASVVAMREFRRVLRHGGILCIRNSTTDLVIDFDI
jgi:ubiquinone/menaquinone biosynthesis C-methylase UbiE